MLLRSVAFRPHFSMGLAFSVVVIRLPSGRRLREATVGHFEAGPLHNFLEKGESEPKSVGKLESDAA